MGQVILDDLQAQITTMSECLDNRKGILQSQVQSLVQRSVALSSQISALINDIGRENIDRQTSMMIRELKAGWYQLLKYNSKSFWYKIQNHSIYSNIRSKLCCKNHIGGQSFRTTTTPSHKTMRINFECS